MKDEERLWLHAMLIMNCLCYQEMERPIMIVYGIKWKCEESFRETGIERLKWVQLNLVLYKLYKEISELNLLCSCADQVEEQEQKITCNNFGQYRYHLILIFSSPTLQSHWCWISWFLL